MSAETLQAVTVTTTSAPSAPSAPSVASDSEHNPKSESGCHSPKLSMMVNKVANSSSNSNGGGGGASPLKRKCEDLSVASPSYSANALPTMNSEVKRQYIEELISEKDNLTNIINDNKITIKFKHIFNLLDKEISKHSQDNQTEETVDDSICQFLSAAPENSNQKIIKKTRKIYMATDKYPTFNFVGRIVGPRGRTIKEIESKTGVKMLIRGRGSMKDSNMEEARRGKPNYEHLNEKLHVVLSIDGSEDYCRKKLDYAEKELRALTDPEIVESAGGRDDIKKRQLNELAILNSQHQAQQLAGSLKLDHSALTNANAASIAVAAGLTTNPATATAMNPSFNPSFNHMAVPQVLHLNANGIPQISLHHGLNQATGHQPTNQTPAMLNIKSPIEGTPIFYPVGGLNNVTASYSHHPSSHTHQHQYPSAYANPNTTTVQTSNGQFISQISPHSHTVVTTSMAGSSVVGSAKSGGKMESSLMTGKAAGHSPY